MTVDVPAPLLRTDPPAGVPATPARWRVLTWAPLLYRVGEDGPLYGPAVRLAEGDDGEFGFVTAARVHVTEGTMTATTNPPSLIIDRPDDEPIVFVLFTEDAAAAYFRRAAPVPSDWPGEVVRSVLADSR